MDTFGGFAALVRRFSPVSGRSSLGDLTDGRSVDTLAGHFVLLASKVPSETFVSRRRPVLGASLRGFLYGLSELDGIRLTRR